MPSHCQLPIGIQTFREIIESDGHYVDKTDYVPRLIEQGKDRGYADKYRAEACPIHLIGVEFSRKQRSIVGFEVEEAQTQLSFLSADHPDFRR